MGRRQLFAKDIGSADDIARLEVNIRLSLNCETNECAALRSTAYRSMKTAMLLRLNKKLGHEAPLKTFLSDQICLVVDGNASRATLYAVDAALALDEDEEAASQTASTVEGVRRKNTKEAQYVEEASRRFESEADSVELQQADFAQVVGDCGFMKRVMVHCMNHGVQDFADPLTSTLILMGTTPMQLAFCESGVILFRTSALPVFPYEKVPEQQRAVLDRIMARSQAAEQYHGSGKYMVEVPCVGGMVMSRRDVLATFAHVMLAEARKEEAKRGGRAEGGVDMRQVGNIVIQRFIAAVTVLSEDTRAAMAVLWPDGRADA